MKSHLPGANQQTPTPPPPPSSQISPHARALTSSNSFDSKSNQPVTNFGMYNMSAEAARLFQTLQQSPLPIASHDVI